MFFDGYDLYIAGGVLASAVQTKFSTVPQNLQFISLTFVGMTLGALITGFVGDSMGRRFTYQINLLIFGLASLAAAFAQDMNQLIVCRFVQGLGLGAEIVVGYSTLTEFVPPKTRGRWLSIMAFLMVSRFPVTAMLGYLIIPDLRLAADVRHRRHRLADRLVSAQEPAGIAALARIAGPHRGSRSPDAINRAGIRAAASRCRRSWRRRRFRRSTASDMLQPPLLQRMIVGSWVLITINTLIFGFVIFLPQFFLRQGLTIANSLAIRWCCRRLAGRLRARRLSVRCHRPALEHHRRVDRHHRRWLDLCPLQCGVRSDARALASASS